MVIPGENAPRICRLLPTQPMKETHVFGTMDLSAKIIMAVEIIAVIGAVIGLAMVTIRWLKAQRR